jgi:hypothetical protein
MQAMIAFNGGNHPGRIFEDVLLAMFIQDDYTLLLPDGARIEITFMMQDDEAYPLRYFSKVYFE